MELYLPVTNPLRLWPLTELNPQTCEADYCRPQVFFPGDVIRFQIATSEKTSVAAGLTEAVWVDPDGVRTPADIRTDVKEIYTGNLGISWILNVSVPDLPLCRLEFRFEPVRGGGGLFRSGWITTTADRESVVKIAYYAYEDPDPSVSEAATVAIDTYFPAKGPKAEGYLPYVYVPGGFFTRGYAPSIDDDSYLTERYVSRYTHAYPRTSRTLVLGDARGIDNALAATLNAAFCLNFEVEGRRYVRYDGAQLEAMGNDALPLRAWSIALQAYDGDTAVRYDPAAWDEGVDGAVIDASRRYVLDASGRYVKL